ncbi:MAG: flagellar hook-length control protein FliK [Ignavibacteriales bacterium]|nr:flagellar hook-length control protein FliK [Ignavibacteriales bacterium]
MNFSNFFIEKLAETESSLTIGSKKPVTNPFLFQDIIKVCEQENAAQNVTVPEAGKTESTLEIFAPTENVIKVSPEEFTSLTQLIASLISQNTELQPTETKHKIEDADITKLQFIVPEEKLVELTSKFIDGTSFSLIPLKEINNSSEISKQLTVSYKSGPNKLSVTLNPIKVDENYTSKVINDEFSFVNKLIVNEGLLQNIPFSSKNDSELVEKDLSLFEESAVEETVESIPIEETKTEVNEKIFYKAEIIKIEVPESVSESDLIKVSQSNNSHEELLNINILFQQSGIPIVDGTANSNNNPSSLFESIDVEKITSPNTLPEIKVAAENKQPQFESTPIKTNSSVKEAKTESKHEAATELGNGNGSKSAAILTVEQQKNEPSILVGTTKENIVNDKSSPASLNDLMEGLTDEEKSVFRSFTASGEIKEIKYESTIKEAQTDSSKKTSAKTTVPVEQKIAEETQPSVIAAEETNSGKAATYQSAENDEALERADVKKSLSASTKFPKQMDAVIEKSATVENTHAVESKTSANVVFENEGVIEPAKTKESASTKPHENIEAVAGEHVAQEKVDDEDLVVKEKVTPKKEVLSNDKTITRESTKETSFKKFENRPKLVSKEEFLALKNANQVAQPKVTVEEQTTKENIGLTNGTIESAIAEETSAVNKQTAQPEIEKKANEVFSEGKLLVKVSAKASIKVDKSSKEEIEAKPHSGQNPAKEVKSNDTEKVFRIEEKFASETTKTVNQKEGKVEQAVANINAEVSSAAAKEKATQVKTEIDSKEQPAVNTKETKQTSEPQTNQQSDKENSKSSSSETFKNHLNQVAPTDKNFEIENLKPQVEAKQAHEAFKTVKQHEIMPECSKLILQGEKQTMTLQLTPENLGKVKLTVDMIENQIVTKIEVENEQVKQFVQSNIEQLKQNMQSAGVPLTNVNVSLADDQRNQKVFTQKKKSLSRDEKEDVIEETKMNVSKKKMGYNTYEFTA